MATQELLIGDTWAGEVDVVAGDAPVDLTDAAITVQFRRPNNGTLIADATTTIIDAKQGRFRWEVGWEATKDAPEGAIDWGVRVTIDNRSWTVLRGRWTGVRGSVELPTAPEVEP